jgi:hypothetical protein
VIKVIPSNEDVEIKKNENEIIINIASPDEEGISYNKFKVFRVSKDKKIIFNNLSSNMKKKTICVKRNPKLKFGEAKIIINEIEDDIVELSGNLMLVGSVAAVIFISPQNIIISNLTLNNMSNLSIITGRIKKDHNAQDILISNSSNRGILVENTDEKTLDPDAKLNQMNIISSRIYIFGEIRLPYYVLNLTAGSAETRIDKKNIENVTFNGEIGKGLIGTFEGGNITAKSVKIITQKQSTLPNELSSKIFEQFDDIVKSKHESLQDLLKHYSDCNGFVGFEAWGFAQIGIFTNITSVSGDIHLEARENINIGEASYVLHPLKKNVNEVKLVSNGNMIIKFGGDTIINFKSELVAKNNLIVETIGNFRVVGGSILKAENDIEIKTNHLWLSSVKIESTKVLAGNDINIITPQEGEGPLVGQIDLWNHRIIAKRNINMKGRFLHNFGYFKEHEIHYYSGKSLISGNDVTISMTDIVDNLAKYIDDVSKNLSVIVAKENLKIITTRLHNNSTIIGCNSILVQSVGLLNSGKFASIVSKKNINLKTDGVFRIEKNSVVYAKKDLTISANVHLKNKLDIMMKKKLDDRFDNFRIVCNPKHNIGKDDNLKIIYDLKHKGDHLPNSLPKNPWTDIGGELVGVILNRNSCVSVEGDIFLNSNGLNSDNSTIDCKGKINLQFNDGNFTMKSSNIFTKNININLENVCFKSDAESTIGSEKYLKGKEKPNKPMPNTNMINDIKTNVDSVLSNIKVEEI